MAKTVLIGEYLQSDGWHLAKVFDSAATAADWRRRVDESGGR